MKVASMTSKELYREIISDDESIRKKAYNLGLRMRRGVVNVTSFCSIYDLIGNDRFADLLQITEGYLMLQEIYSEFLQKYPSAPVITTHDAIFTRPEYLPDLKRLILGRFPRITGAKVGL